MKEVKKMDPVGRIAIVLILLLVAAAIIIPQLQNRGE